MNQNDYNNLQTQLKQSINIGQDKIEDHVNRFVEGGKESLAIASAGITEDALENTVHQLIYKGKKVTNDAVKSAVEKGKNIINTAQENINNSLSSKLKTGNAILDDTKNKINSVVDKVDQIKSKISSSARLQASESSNIKNANSANLDEIENRVQTRFNNLDGNAQKRSSSTFRNNPKYQEDPETFKGRKVNVRLREKAIQKEEINPNTTFKDNKLNVDITKPIDENNIFDKVETVRNPPTFEVNVPQQQVAPKPTDTLQQEASQSTKDNLKVYTSEEADEAGEGSKIAKGIVKSTEAEEAEGAEEGADFDPVGLAFEAVLGVGGAIASQFINSHKQKITAPQVTNYSVAQGQ